MKTLDKLDQVSTVTIQSSLSEEELSQFKAAIETLDAQGEIHQKFYFGENKMVLPPKKKESKYFRFRQYQWVDKPIEEVFEFFSDAKNLERITPDQLSFRIDSQSTDKIEEGTEFIYKLKIHGVPAKWKTVITNWNPPYEFVDYQQKGPYQVWFHSHLFIPYQNGTILVDEVKFILPFSFISNFLVGWFIKFDVKNIFKHRYQYIKDYYL